jgi:hypothetical protein
VTARVVVVVESGMFAEMLIRYLRADGRFDVTMRPPAPSITDDNEEVATVLWATNTEPPNLPRFVRLPRTGDRRGTMTTADGTQPVALPDMGSVTSALLRSCAESPSA